MARFTLIGAAAIGLIVLVGVCFAPAIGGRQFAYRDAAHYYYPLYQKVQAEWDAGRVPLWENEENAGMPYLGNPTAAVLYPGKLIYAALPYPLAARAYVIAHILLAVAGMLLLAKALGMGTTGAVIAGFAYAFGAPVLFQYCNVIYLVGAAWVPWGFHAIDGWLRRGRRSAIAELAIVLAMQVLGGDPLAAYLEGLCAGAYAIMRARGQAERPRMTSARKLRIGVVVLAFFAAWVVLTFISAHHLAGIRPKKNPMPTFVWNKYVSTVILGCWALVGLFFLRRWMKAPMGSRDLGRWLTGLAVAAVLGAAIAGAQLLPVLEFARLTGRGADEGAHDIYPFSLEPYRVVELVWPNVFGTLDRGNRSWLSVIPPITSHRIWIPSLYLGGTTIVLAMGAAGFRGGPVWRRWLTGIALVTLLASFGEFAGPLWVGRFFRPIADYVGPHDPVATNAIRMDGSLRDGDGSFYWLLSIVIPGFQQFRYPSKLLTFTVAAFALLAGHGWDRIEAGDRKRFLNAAGFLVVLSAVGAALAHMKQESIATFFSRTDIGSVFGPLEPSGAVVDLRNALIQGVFVFGLTITAALLVSRRPRIAGAILILTVAGDLAFANHRLIMTADQSEFERTPRVLQVIEEAEKANPSPGPYRVHRMSIWNPPIWHTEASPQRAVDMIRWERDTLQPKYGLPYGVQYTQTEGVAEIYDHEWFFGPFLVDVEPSLAKQLGLSDPKEQVVYYPRRGFDLWNTRYFILPAYTPATHPHRGVLSLIEGSESIYPKQEAFAGANSTERLYEWMKTHDFQVFRNPSVFPRAWIVHDVRLSPPIEGLTREARQGPMTEMLYANDRLWRKDSRNVFDLNALAYVEVADATPLQPFRTGGPTGQDETVTVRAPNPRRVELDVVLNRPGFVILSEVFYPGWTLTINGRAATILRANRLMRGAAVESGKHTLIYEYHPRSFAVGKVVSLVGLVGLVMMIGWAARSRRVDRIETPLPS